MSVEITIVSRTDQIKNINEQSTMLFSLSWLWNQTILPPSPQFVLIQTTILDGQLSTV